MKKTIVALLGASGSGKSTLRQKLAEQIYVPAIISTDEIRGVLSGDENCLDRDRDVFVVVEYLLKYNLRAGNPIIADSTHYSRKNRKMLFKYAREYGAKIVFYYLDTSLEQCKINNKKRDRVVPDWVIEKQFNNLTLPTAEEADGVEFEIRTIKY